MDQITFVPCLVCLTSSGFKVPNSSSFSTLAIPGTRSVIIISFCGFLDLFFTSKVTFTSERASSSTILAVAAVLVIFIGVWT